MLIYYSVQTTNFVGKNLSSIVKCYSTTLLRPNSKWPWIPWMVYYFLMKAQFFLSVFVAWTPRVCVTHNAVHGRKGSQMKMKRCSWPCPSQRNNGVPTLVPLPSVFSYSTMWSKSALFIPKLSTHQYKWVISSNTNESTQQRLSSLSTMP